MKEMNRFAKVVEGLEGHEIIRVNKFLYGDSELEMLSEDRPEAITIITRKNGALFVTTITGTFWDDDAVDNEANVFLETHHLAPYMCPMCGHPLYEAKAAAKDSKDFNKGQYIGPHRRPMYWKCRMCGCQMGLTLMRKCFLSPTGNYR
jgi:hypothetical protein